MTTTASNEAGATAAPATPAPPTPPEPTPNVGEPEWLPKRIEQAKRSAIADALKDLGVEDVAAAKAAIAKARELEEAKKTEAERFADRLKVLEPAAKRATDLDARLARYADAEMAKLTDEQRAAVVALAGDDKGRALDTIEALRPTWTPAAAATATAEQAAASKPPLPAPATTTAGGATPPVNLSPTVNHKATWESLRSTNPFLAAQYLEEHRFQIFPPQG